MIDEFHVTGADGKRHRLEGDQVYCDDGRLGDATPTEEALWAEVVRLTAGREDPSPPREWNTPQGAARVWAAMETLPDWNGRRNHYPGLSSYWAKRAHAAEEALEAAEQERDGYKNVFQVQRARAEAAEQERDHWKRIATGRATPGDFPK